MSTQITQGFSQDVSLVVDGHNRIIELSDSWESIAEQGGAGNRLLVDKVLGLSLKSFIQGDMAWMAVETALKLCRLKRQPYRKAYRCDSPTHKRFMQMALIPLPPYEAGLVKMEHILIKEEPFEKPIYIQDMTRQQNLRTHAQLILRCSFCNLLKNPQLGIWQAPETFEAHQSAQQPLQVVHTVCPVCKANIQSLNH